MKKHTYRSTNVNKINWSQVQEKQSGGPVTFAIDIAKTKQFALLSDPQGDISTMVWWNHPEQTPAMLEVLESFTGPVDVVMESTGTYGDALRYQFIRSGFGIYQVSGKRVSDAQEIYDGVPSLHDAKSAYLITRLHQAGVSQAWVELSEEERNLNALRREYDLYQSEYQRNQNRLEAVLSRHWPEVQSSLTLDSVTLESLLIEYGSPAAIGEARQAAAHNMRSWGKSQLKDAVIDEVLNGALQTLGQPCSEAEVRYLQALASEMKHSRLQKKTAKQALEALVQADTGLQYMAELIGRVTTAVLLSCRLDPRRYHCANSYLKALGLNLKEKSSGQQAGQLRLTKRGHSIARSYLYFAAMRLIKNDPVAKAWYQHKVDPKAKKKALIAVMRKLAKALWHVARGEAFDAQKLFTLPA